MLNLNNLPDLPKPPTAAPRSGGRHHVNRSLSEFTSSVKAHHRQHHHTHRHRHHRRKDHQPDDMDPSVTLGLPLKPQSHDMPRSEAATPFRSPDQSRRPSIQVPRDDDVKLDSKESRDERLRLEREKATIRADGLKQSLADLNTFSTNMTKQLDDEYYSVLEKASTLQNTIMAMKDLAESSRQLCETFDREARGLESDITSQLKAVGNFDDQQTRISGLQSRIHEGRAKIQSLSGRVDVVRERVESWERADRAWQERTRKRLKIIWSATTVLTILIVAVAVGVNYTSTGLDGDSSEATLLGWLNKSHHSRAAIEDAGETGRARLWKTPSKDDEQLRMFDEL